MELGILGWQYDNICFFFFSSATGNWCFTSTSFLFCFSDLFFSVKHTPSSASTPDIQYFWVDISHVLCDGF